MRLFQRNEHSKREHTPTGGDEKITAIVYVKDNEKSIFNKNRYAVKQSSNKVVQHDILI